jgi:hypothetical protein
VVDRTAAVGYFDMDFDFAVELQPPPPPPGAPDAFDRQFFDQSFQCCPSSSA